MALIIDVKPDEQIDLKAVYDELNRKSIFRKKATSNLLSNFARLIATKSSFSHRVHKEFLKQTNNLPF